MQTFKLLYKIRELLEFYHPMTLIYSKNKKVMRAKKNSTSRQDGSHQNLEVTSFVASEVTSPVLYLCIFSRVAQGVQPPVKALSSTW